VSTYYITNDVVPYEMLGIDSSSGEVADAFGIPDGFMLVGNSQNGLLYLGNEVKTLINVIDPETRTVAVTITPALSNAFYNNFDIDPALHRLYIFEEAGVLVYDTDTNEQVDFFGVSGTIAFSTPKGLVDPTTHNLVLFFGGYPTNCAQATVLDSNGGTVTAISNLCGDYKESALSPDGQTLYSIGYNYQSPDNNLRIYDMTSSMMTTEALPGSVTDFLGIAVNSKNGNVYLMNATNWIYVYHPATRQFSGPFDVGSFGSVNYYLGAAFDPDRNQLLLRSFDQLKIVDTGTMTTVNDIAADVANGNFQKPAILTQSGPCGGGATGPTGATSPITYNKLHYYNL